MGQDSNSKLKPWPADSVVIVAANRGEEQREFMESAIPVVCRDCGDALYADSRTIRTAAELPSRRERPITYLCISCCTAYDSSSLTEIHDHRGVKP